MSDFIVKLALYVRKILVIFLQRLLPFPRNVLELLHNQSLPPLKLFLVVPAYTFNFLTL